MQGWQQRRRGGGTYDTGANANTETMVTIPLGPGEWDEALGLPLCVVCHNVGTIRVKSKCNLAEEMKSVILTRLPFSLIRSISWRSNRDGGRKSLTMSCNFYGPSFLSVGLKTKAKRPFILDY